ncbi:hypothetical protein [Ekhidna sp.]|uniref:hypothetical protein n=1 Tax=Ekhidna sp. TaxID=2608089 RepID=UPI003517AF99
MKVSVKSVWKIAMIFAVGFLYSCSDSDDPVPEVEEEEVVIDTEKKVTIKGGVTPIGSTSGRTESISVSTFLVNVTDVAFVIDETDDRSATEETYTSDDLSGPFLLDLLSGDLNLAGIEVPLGVYDEITFNVSPSADPSSSLDGKSILIEGSIDGTAFSYWTDAEESFEVNFSKNGGDLNVSESGFVVTINFDLDAMFGANGAIDLTSSTDGNEDGTIEISPNDQDGNHALAFKILSELEENADANEDEDLDEDGIGNSEDDDIDGDGVSNDEDDDDDNDGVSDAEDADADGDGIDDDLEGDGTGETDDDGEEEDVAADIVATLSAEAWVITEYTTGEYNHLAQAAGLYHVTFGDNAAGDTIRIENNGQWEDGDWEIITNTDTPIIIFDFDYYGFFPGMEGVWEIISVSEAKLELQGDIQIESGVETKICVMEKPQ